MPLTNPETAQPNVPKEEATYPRAVPDQTRRSLGDIVNSIKDTRAKLLDPNFDPEIDIGSLVDGDVEDLMTKVDNTVSYNQALSDFAYNAEMRAAAELKAAATARKRIEANEMYVMMQLDKAKAEEFAGRQFRYKKVRNGNPSVIPFHEASAEDLVNLGDQFIRVIPEKVIPLAYEWDKKAICRVLKDIEDREPIPGDAVLDPLQTVARLDYGYALKFEPVDKPIEKKKGKKK